MDVVDSLSNSPRLIAILNTLGVTTSKSTLDRYIREVGQRRDDEGPFKQLTPGHDLSHVVVSVDNVDKVAGGVRHDGKKAADFHAVTVQLHCKKSIRRPPPGISQSCKQSVAADGGRRAGEESREAAEGGAAAMESADATTSGAGVEGDPRGTANGGDATPATAEEPAELEGGAGGLQRRRARSLTEGAGGRTGFQAPGREGTEIRASLSLDASAQYQGPFTDLQRAGKPAADVLELTAEERASCHSLRKTLFRNVLRRERTARADSKRASLRDEMASKAGSAGSAGQIPEPSEIIYVATYDLKVSNKEELTECLCRVKRAMQIGSRQPYLLVVGDQQCWNLMVDIKNDMPEDFAWLFPFPGDWHTLYNAQPVFQKIFFDAGELYCFPCQNPRATLQVNPRQRPPLERCRESRTPDMTLSRLYRALFTCPLKLCITISASLTYFCSGLDRLATKMGYVEKTVKTALKESRNFRKNHLFLIECWEAIYRRLFQLFLESRSGNFMRLIANR